MKIDGEDIKTVADHTKGAASTTEPMLRATDNVLGEVGRRLVHGMSRKARIVEFKEAAFENASDWTASEDEAVTVHAGVTGGTTIDLSEPVEFVHFGRVYRDRSHLFGSPKLDDTVSRLVALRENREAAAGREGASGRGNQSQVTSQHAQNQSQVTSQHAQNQSQVTSQHAQNQQNQSQVTSQHAQSPHNPSHGTSQHAQNQSQVTSQHAQNQQNQSQVTSQHAQNQQNQSQVTSQHAQNQQNQSQVTSQHAQNQQNQSQVTSQHAQNQSPRPPGAGRAPAAGRTPAPGRTPPGRTPPREDADGDQSAAGAEIPAHGLMFRAAMQREAILLGGFVRAHMDALIAEEKSKGAIGVLAQVVADLTGSAGGTADKPNAVDLNPFLKKIIEAQAPINAERVDYPALHTAGVELHVARKAYREYLVKELEKRHAPPAKKTTPGGGVLNDQTAAVNQSVAAGHDWLGKKPAADDPSKDDAVPRLTALVPPSVQNFLSMAQKISFKAWDVSAALNYEYSTRLEPIIEDACRRMTESAVQKRSTPIFAIWHMDDQPIYTLPPNLEEKIFGKVQRPIDGATGKALAPYLSPVTQPVSGALHDFDKSVGIDKTIDFFSRPDRYTPGRPFLDDIFLITPDADAPDVPDAAKRARVGWSGGLGQMAVDSFKGALQIDTMPTFLEWTIGKVSTVCAEFVRAVYSKLLVIDDNAVVTQAELHEAAKRHLVGNVIESILGGLDFVQNIRKEQVDIPIAEVAFSVDAVIGRAKDLATVKLEEFIDPVIKYAMRDLHGMIFAYRRTAIQNQALTLEVHLAQLPTVFSRLFRNVFFPLWDKVLERGIEAISASISPRMVDAGRSILKARGQAEQVRGKMVQALAALDTLPGKLPDAEFKIGSPKESVQRLKKDWNPIAKNAKSAWDGAEVDSTQDTGPLEHDELEQAFPVRRRLKKVIILKVTPEHLKLVAPKLKWRLRRLKAIRETAEPAAPAPAAPMSATPAHPPPRTKEAPPERTYAYGDYPLSSSPSPYAQSQPMSHPGAGTLAEKTTELHVSDDLKQLAELDDMEQTVDIDHAAPSGLPPFLGGIVGPSKKA